MFSTTKARRCPHSSRSSSESHSHVEMGSPPKLYSMRMLRRYLGTTIMAFELLKTRVMH